MKRILFVLLGMFLVSISYSQNNILSIERNVSEHFVDTLYIVKLIFVIQIIQKVHMSYGLRGIILTHYQS